MRRVRFDTGEVEPALVDESGIPAVLPLRWVMCKRRLEAAVNTIEGELRGVAELYEWALSAPTLAAADGTLAATVGAEAVAG